MSNNRGLAEQLPTFAPAPQDPVTPARPKVMRRPAHFSDMRPTTTTPSIVMPAPNAMDKNEDLSLAATAPPQAAPTLVSKPWQDDVRFGIAMLTIVVLVNLVLMLWLPNMHPVAVSAADAEPQAVTGAVTTPPDHSLTFYTKPAATKCSGPRGETASA